MTYTLAQVTLDVARIVAHVVEGIATGPPSTGSATTLIDTAFQFTVDGVNAPIDDYYNFGTIWFIDGASANKARLITDWDQSDKTWTYVTTTTKNMVGDLYAVTDRTFPLYALNQAVNRAYADMGGLEATNTALTTLASTVSYAFPTGVYNILDVEVANETASPYTWQRHNNWRVVGSTIEFDRVPTSGRTIRLTYRITPTYLDEDTNPTISDNVPIDLLKWTAAVFALEAKLRLVENDEPKVKTDLTIALDKARRKVLEHRASFPRTPKANHYNTLVG